MCDQEVRNITRTCTPPETSTHVMSPIPGSSATVDYSTQGDPDQPAYSTVSGLAYEQQLILNTHNYLLPDSSGRRIYYLPASQYQPFMLGYGHAAYQIELENFEAILETNTFLMDRLTGQFHAAYEDGYTQMATTPKLLHPWQSGQLIAKLDETQLQFGLPPKAETSPAKQQAANRCLPQSVIQRSQSHNQESANDDEAVPDFMDERAQPRAIVYLEPSFSLQRPAHRLKIDKRLEVHNNYISAISNRMHRIDLIYRLKRSEPHNAAHCQRQLEQQLVHHDDVIHKLVDIMKMDDYFRRTEDLPMIDPLVAYEEVEQLPELFDAKEAVSRNFIEVDIIERQMH